MTEHQRMAQWASDVNPYWAGGGMKRSLVLPDGNMPPHPDSSQQLHSPFREQMNLSSPPGPYLHDSGSQGGGSNTGDDSYLDGPSDSKRKKGAGVAGKSIEEELCRICGDRASGYHYNALSCEGCKGFFRRSITKTASYVCKYGGNCEMDMWMRRKCQACRLRRCREVGMKEECLLSEDQCKARDARRKSKARPSIKKEVVSPDSNEGVESLTSNPTLETLNSPSMSPALEDGNMESIRGCMENEDHWKIILELLKLQEKFELPETDKVELATAEFDALKSPDVTAEGLFKSMTEMTVLITGLIVEFAKHLLGFNELDQHDQIILLKAASSEVMSIRAARRYDLKSETIIFANAQPCTLKNMLDAGLGKYAELVYDFCKSMAIMQTDDTEYALLTTICLFSERPGLKDKERVEQIQSRYVDVLQSYETAKRRRGGSALGKFLTRLMDLRSISAEHSLLIVDLKKMGKDLPELINQAYIPMDDD